MRERPADPARAYRTAGVDLDAADRVKRRFKALVEATFGPEVLGGLGGFGGAFALGGLPEADPVLVASADGAGTKVLIAQAAGRHDTVGEDLVHHCVDDLLAAGARPLFFLDSIATGRLDEEVTLAIVEGFARGCRVNGIPLLGGETAEMPDLYAGGRYDLAGFIVGVAPRARLADWPRARAGDLVLGLESSGLHTNGYTLARRIVIDTAGHALGDRVPWGGETWADALLRVHRSYLRAVGPLLDDPALRAAAHITGGGFAGNLPRVLPAGLGVELDRGAWHVPPIFGYLAEVGAVAEEEMVRVFNMGIGFCLIVDSRAADRVAADCDRRGFPATPIGRVVEGRGVTWS
ncbi:MAG TPA: phosphoribosylformylglycinamidine cyclo-ligase [Gemmatimonadota bacterium]|nr:phosphoribosylformylglycinamidine cyclo-ligase [Gemmatimonadota bacterium]